MSPAELMIAASALGGPPARELMVSNRVVREHHPWDTFQLSKADRKGKSPEEIQALRKQRWEASWVQPKDGE